MITTNTGAKKIENSDNWREIFDAHNTSVDAADRIQPEVAPIINGKQCALSVAVGNFVLLRNSTISGKADGAYEVTKAIPANTNLDSTYIANNPIGGGIANELNSNLTENFVTNRGPMRNINPDNITQNGILYFSGIASDADYPTDAETTGFLINFKGTPLGQYVQIIIPWNSSVFKYIYIRTYTNNVWYEWMKISAT